jgi:hypothetical protein
MDVVVVVKLLRSKNRCLRTLLELSDEFVKATMHGGFPTVDAALPTYQSQRDGIIKAIELYDRKLNESISTLSPAERTPELIEKLRKDVELSDSLVRGILRKDEEINKRLNDAKLDLLRELTANERNKAIANKFKSGWMPGAGEGLDRKA